MLLEKVKSFFCIGTKNSDRRDVTVTVFSDSEFHVSEPYRFVDPLGDLMRGRVVELSGDAGAEAETVVAVQINMNLAWNSPLGKSKREAIRVDRRNSAVLARVPDEGRRGLVVNLFVGREKVEERAVVHAVLTEKVDERAHMREL